MPKEIALVEDIKGTSRKILDENLPPGEPLHVFMEGVKGQSVAATERSLMIIKTGFGAGGVGFGKKCKIFPYEHITSIDCDKGMLQGRLQVSAAGTHEERGGYFTGAFRAENVVNFNAGSYRKFQVATNRIRELIDAYKSARGAASPSPDSIPDQIKKLAELRDAGILTAEEFEGKKQQLLDRI